MKKTWPPFSWFCRPSTRLLYLLFFRSEFGPFESCQNVPKWTMNTLVFVVRLIAVFKCSEVRLGKSIGRRWPFLKGCQTTDITHCVKETQKRKGLLMHLLLAHHRPSHLLALSRASCCPVGRRSILAVFSYKQKMAWGEELNWKCFDRFSKYWHSTLQFDSFNRMTLRSMNDLCLPSPLNGPFPLLFWGPISLYYYFFF